MDRRKILVQPLIIRIRIDALVNDQRRRKEELERFPMTYCDNEVHLYAGGPEIQRKPLKCGAKSTKRISLCKQ